MYGQKVPVYAFALRGASDSGNDDVEVDDIGVVDSTSGKSN